MPIHTIFVVCLGQIFRCKTVFIQQFLGCFHWLTTLTFDGSTEIPSSDTKYPKNATFSSRNSYFENFAYNLFSLNFSNTIFKCNSCSSIVRDYTKISSIKTMTNLSKYSSNTWFIKFMNATGAFVSPNDIIKNS